MSGRSGPRDHAALEIGVAGAEPALLALVGRAEAWAAAAVDPAASWPPPTAGASTVPGASAGDAADADDAAAADAADAAAAAAADDGPWRDSALVWAGTHYGAHTTPPLAEPPWPWLPPLLAAHPPVAPGRTLILGGACGGALLALPKAAGAALVLDAAPHALALGAALARRVGAGRAAALPHRAEPWTLERRPLSLSPTAVERLAAARWLLADAADPPLRPASFELILALGLLDSVADPWFVLQQAAALLAQGGLLLVAAPWCDRPDITPAPFSLSAIARRLGHSSPTAALAAGALWAGDGAGRRGALEPELWPRCIWRADRLDWVVRSHDRLHSRWALDALLFQAPPG